MLDLQTSMHLPFYLTICLSYTYCVTIIAYGYFQLLGLYHLLLIETCKRYALTRTSDRSLYFLPTYSPDNQTLFNEVYKKWTCEKQVSLTLRLRLCSISTKLKSVSLKNIVIAKRTPKPKIVLLRFYYQGYLMLNHTILLNHAGDVI